MVRTLLALSCMCFLGACQAVDGSPPRPADATEVEATLAQHVGARFVSGYYAAPQAREGLSRKDYRDRFVATQIILINENYASFRAALRGEDVAGQLAFDAALLGLGAAGTVVGGASLKAVLAAVSTALTGLNASYDKTALLEKTVTLLISRMDANRALVLNDIKLSLAMDEETYTPLMVLSDMERYYYAGTIPGALASINEETGLKAKQGELQAAEIASIERPAFFLTEEFDTLGRSLIEKLRTAPDEYVILLAGDPVPDTTMLGGKNVIAFFRELHADKIDPSTQRWTGSAADARTFLENIIQNSQDQEALARWRARLS